MLLLYVFSLSLLLPATHTSAIHKKSLSSNHLTTNATFFLKNFVFLYSQNLPVLVLFDSSSEMFTTPLTIDQFVSENGHMLVGVHKDSLQMQLGDGENPSVETSIAEFSSQMQEIKSNGESAMVFDMHESARKFMQVHGKYMHKLASPTLLLPENSEIVLSMSHPNSGVLFHSHAEAYFYLGEGSKNWMFLPPSVKRVPGYPSNDFWILLNAEANRTIASIVNEYRYSNKSMKSDYPELVEIHQPSNSLLFVPKNWWHGTWSQEASIGLSVQPLEGWCYVHESEVECTNRILHRWKGDRYADLRTLTGKGDP